MVLFFATGSFDIVLARLLGLAFGSLAAVLIFLLCHRYWGMRVAIAAGAFAALSPVAIFNDVSGLAEPIAIAETTEQRLVEMIIGRKLEALVSDHHDLTDKKVDVSVRNLAGGSLPDGE